jgi:hypothetical protein
MEEKNKPKLRVKFYQTPNGNEPVRDQKTPQQELDIARKRLKAWED